MEELGQTQPVPKQVLWEGGKQDEQLLPQRLSVGAEPSQNRQDGGRDAEVEAKGPPGNPPQHG